MDCQAILDTIVHQMFSIRVGQANHKSSVQRQNIPVSEESIIHSLTNVHDLNCRDIKGSTLLTYAAAYHLHFVMDYLLQHGADVNRPDSQGTTPLHAAVNNSNWLAVSKLIQHGANPNLQDKWGNTPLLRANAQCPISVIRLLVDAGADPKIPNNFGVTAFVAFEAYPDIIQAIRRCNPESDMIE